MSTKIEWLCPKCGAKGETIESQPSADPEASKPVTLKLPVKTTQVDWMCDTCGHRGRAFFTAGNLPESPACEWCGKPTRPIAVALGVELHDLRELYKDADAEAPKPDAESSEITPLSEAEVDKLLGGLKGLIGDKGPLGPRASIFSEAEQTINGPRAEDYGDASESFDRIGALWSAYLRTFISPADVAMMMALLKMVRLKHSGFTHHDSFVDLLGYVGLAHKVSGEK